MLLLLCIPILPLLVLLLQKRRRTLSIVILAFLMLCCLQFSAYSQPAPATSPTPLLSPPSSSRDDGPYMWIVQGNSTGKPAPNCSDLCVAEFNDFMVTLLPCAGKTTSEKWLYDPQSHSISSQVGISDDLELCMDAADPFQLRLVTCNGSPGQMWAYDTQTMKFGGSFPSAYLMGQIRHPSDWGTGKNNYSLQLAAEGTLDHGDFTAVFTLIPSIDPLMTEPIPWIFSTAYSSSEGGNLVANGGFEECNYDPGKGFTTIDGTEPLYLCSWYVASNQVEYWGTNLLRPQEGSHTLHLNSAALVEPASIVQMVPTKPGSNYSLGFFMSENPKIYCGGTNKTMRVEVKPSSLADQDIWYDTPGESEMEYMYVYPLGFTALADYINLTFRSLTPGSCGPVIDNISIIEIHGPLPPLPDPHAGRHGQSSSRGLPIYGWALLGVAVVAMIIAAGMAIITINKRRRRRKKKKCRPSTSEHPIIDMESVTRKNGAAPNAKWWSSFNLVDDSTKENANCIVELTWKQIDKATNSFATVIGEGGFSTVYRAELADGRLGAVKMERSRDRSRQIFKQELSVLCRLRHPNLVNLIGFCNERDEGILVFEYMAHGNLHHRLHPLAHQMHVPLCWKKRMEIAMQVAHALHYLHDMAKPAVVHGDIKSANVLLDEDDNAKLCDFGFSSKAGPNSSMFHSTLASVKGSLGYLDPQYLKNGVLSSKSDVYSFGVLLIEIITGLRAFDMHRSEALTSFATPYVQDMDMMELIVDARLCGKFDKSELQAMCSVARSCVQEDSTSRPTMSQVISQLSSSIVGLSSTTTHRVTNEDGLNHSLCNSP